MDPEYQHLLKDKVHAIYPETVEIYRKLHRNPEIGLEEHQTSTFVRQYLTKIEGLEILPPLPALPTAVIAQIIPQKQERTILLRCELDALNFKEESSLQFSSLNSLHHACGHDAHMAMMLSTAKIAAESRNILKKKIIFCFQPGQQGKQGAKKLIEAYPSLLEKVDNCFALHFHNAISPGQVKLDPGPVTALSNRFTIQIEGKSAHCLAPQAGIDANYIGCSLVSHLYTLTGTTVPPMEGCSLVVIKVEGGSGVAMVSSNFKISGSLRTFSIESYQKMKKKITQLSQSLCKSFSAKAKVEFNEMCYRPVINDFKLVQNLRKKIIQSGQIKIEHEQKCFAGEDFCQFSQKRPSCYIAVGSALPDSIDPTTCQSLFPAHSPKHKISQQSILFGLKIWLMIVFK